MNGLILAAGDGSRLAADGVRQPKTLVEVGGRPQILHLTRVLRELGCEAVTCMVPTARASQLAELQAPREGGRAVVIGCQTPSSLHTLARGLSIVPAGPVFCTMVDTVMRRRDWAALHAGMAAELAAGAELVLAVTPYVDDERPLYVMLGDRGAVLDLRDEPVEPVHVTGGVYALSPTARTAATQAVDRGAGRMREFLRWAARGGLRTTAVVVPRIIDLDRGSDLAAANQWLAEAEIT